MIKTNCVRCGERASDLKEDDDKRYIERGNWCRACNAWADKNKANAPEGSFMRNTATLDVSTATPQ